jgi:hypothetical protein
LEARQAERRLVGIDLGIASRHSVRVLEAGGQVVCRSSCVPTVASLAAVGRAALAGAPEGTTLAVVSGSDRAGVDADRGVLRPPRARRLPGLIGEGFGPAAVLAPACEAERNRCGDASPDAAGRPGRAAATGAAGCECGCAGPAGARVRSAYPGSWHPPGAVEVALPWLRAQPGRCSTYSSVSTGTGSSQIAKKRRVRPFAVGAWPTPPACRDAPRVVGIPG